MNALIVFAHGSRDPAWREPVEEVARRIAAQRPGWFVRTAYLELTEPDLPTVAATWLHELNAIDSIAMNDQKTPTCAVFPLFFGVGKHAREDLPALMDALRAQHPNARFELLPSAGTLDVVLNASAQAALDSAAVLR